MFLTSFNNMFAFFMAALIPIPALRSFSLQVCADWIKALKIVIAVAMLTNFGCKNLQGCS